MDIDPRFPHSAPDTETGEQVEEFAQNLQSALDILGSVVRKNGASNPVIDDLQGLGDMLARLQSTLFDMIAMDHEAGDIDAEPLQRALDEFELRIVRRYPANGSTSETLGDTGILIDVQAALANLQAQLNLTSARYKMDLDRVALGFKRYADQTGRLAELEERAPDLKAASSHIFSGA